MTDTNGDPLQRMAERVADCISQSGYAFIEDEKIESLATALQSFLRAAGIQPEDGHSRPAARPPAAPVATRSQASTT
ncbi:hypothetical protein [Krasilnikovia sp. MM14-A1259]|uniref:hypothetical protein n=1 Tax=Krasilnikovia sp. MM14-A1259 TaxID=3373539 RepID=UPI0037F8A861